MQPNVGSALEAAHPAGIQLRTTIAGYKTFPLRYLELLAASQAACSLTPIALRIDAHDILAEEGDNRPMPLARALTRQCGGTNNIKADSSPSSTLATQSDRQCHPKISPHSTVESLPTVPPRRSIKPDILLSRRLEQQARR